MRYLDLGTKIIWFRTQVVSWFNINSKRTDMLAWYFNANEKKQIKWNKNKKGFKTLIKEMATLCLQQEEMITEKVPSKERDFVQNAFEKIAENLG